MKVDDRNECLRQARRGMTGWIQPPTMVTTLMLLVALSWVMSCDNLKTSTTYEAGPCGDVDTTSPDASIFTMPRNDVIVYSGMQQKFWTTVAGLSCDQVYYSLSKDLGTVSKDGVYQAPFGSSRALDTVDLIVTSYAKRSLRDTIPIVVVFSEDTCDKNNPTYSGTIQPMIENYCIGCHSQPSYAKSGGGVLLETYEDVRKCAVQGRLLSSIDYSGPYKMPRNATRLRSCVINDVRAWIQKGAPND